jgi:hypothetical protein
MIRIAAACLVLLCLAACAPEVGTEKWCDKMDDTPKGDWSTNDAKAYAQYCIMGNYVDKED